MYGTLCGLLLWATGWVHRLQLGAIVLFDENLFLYLLLPPVIFEAGFSLQKGPFFSNLGAILVFAVLGTLLTTLFIGETSTHMYMNMF